MTPLFFGKFLRVIFASWMHCCYELQFKKHFLFSVSGKFLVGAGHLYCHRRGRLENHSSLSNVKKIQPLDHLFTEASTSTIYPRHQVLLSQGN